MSEQPTKQDGDAGCAIIAVLLFLLWLIHQINKIDTADRCKFEYNVAVAIHNGHIITKGCKLGTR